MELGQEQEPGWAARMEWEQAWAVRMELGQEPAVRMEWEQEQEQEQEPGWAARKEPREIPFLAALAAPRFPAATQAQTQEQAQEQAQAGHRTPNGRCGESDECPAAIALESLSSLADST